MSWSDQEKIELFNCVHDNTVMLGRVDERLKSGDKKFNSIEGRLDDCEKTTYAVKALTKTIFVLSPFVLAGIGLYLQYFY